LLPQPESFFGSGLKKITPLIWLYLQTCFVYAALNLGDRCVPISGENSNGVGMNRAAGPGHGLFTILDDATRRYV
jgi:hypothetical protein